MPLTCDVATVAVTAFICANCARPSQAPDSAGPSSPIVPDFDWPFPVREVLVPCSGRLQPEHVLKAFEAGADLVITVSCENDNCQYLQGSKRWTRRAEYVRTILDEVGLGGKRLMHFYLPGTASIRDVALQALDGLARNPLCNGTTYEASEDIYQQVDMDNEANED